LPGATASRVGFELYLITDRHLLGSRDLLSVCDAVLQALAHDVTGISAALQLREKDLEGRALHELAAALKPICARHRTPLIINDRIDIALAVAADGVHLPAESVTVAEARSLIGSSRLVGISTHSAAEAAAASAAGADFAVFGPVWPPLSKPTGGPAGGTEGLGAACRAAGAMPVFALGGVTAERAAQLDFGGATAAAGGGGHPAGVGVIGAVFGADDPAAAALRLARAIRRAPA